MHAGDDGRTVPFQFAHQGQIPQRTLAVHCLSEDFSRQSLQFRVRPMLQRDLVNVIVDIELRIVFPCRQSGVQGRGYYSHEVTGNQRQTATRQTEIVIELDVAVENADAGHVERHAGPLQI